MKKIQIIYLLSVLPLLMGSLIFFYWFYKRTWYAEEAPIELAAFLTIICFALCALAALILCIVFSAQNPRDWKKIIFPIAIIGLTVPMIDVYGTMYGALNNKSFVRIINDSNEQVDRIWSDNFELTYFGTERKDFIISFYPVYTYDWENYDSSGYGYKVHPAYIELEQSGDSTATYKFPDFYKGDCKTILLTEIIK